MEHYPIHNLSMSDRLKNAGVKTVRENNEVYLEYAGKRIVRGWVQHCENECLKQFGMKI